MSGATIGDSRPMSGELAGFWRRIGAAAIDAFLLGVVGFLLGNAFFDWLLQYGSEARLLGLPVALFYFGLLNSSLAGGTVGKHALGICVVRRDGQGISVLRSLVRGLVYLIPIYLNGFDFSFLSLTPTQSDVAVALDVLLVFGVFGGSVYLYLANWSTRQVVHDLATGTFVVRKSSSARSIDVRINRVHLIVISLIFLLSLAVVPLGMLFLGSDWRSNSGKIMGVDFGALAKIQSTVNADPEVISTGVNLNTNYVSMATGANSRTTTLTVTVVHRGRTTASEDFANRIALRVLQLYPDALGSQRLAIIVRYGFDIGIYSYWWSYNYSFTPSEWRVRTHNSPAGKRSL